MGTRSNCRRVREGLMAGSSTGYFNPKSNITRAEVMTVISRSLPQGYAPSTKTYTDQKKNTRMGTSSCTNSHSNRARRWLPRWLHSAEGSHHPRRDCQDFLLFIRQHHANMRCCQQAFEKELFDYGFCSIPSQGSVL